MDAAVDEAAAAPADYSGLALPEGYRVDDPVFGEAIKLFEGEKIAPDTAQRLIDFTIERDKQIARAVNEHATTSWTKQTAEWRTTSEKEFSRGAGQCPHRACPGVRSADHRHARKPGLHQPSRPDPRDGEGGQCHQGRLVRGRQCRPRQRRDGSEVPLPQLAAQLGTTPHGNAFRDQPDPADWSKVLDPNGGIAQVISLLSQMNEITDDMVWNEGNLPTGHRTSVQTSLPTGTWRRFNEGIVPTKSTSTQITDSCGMLETYSEIDKALADLNGNTAAYRLSEDRAFLEGLTQQLAGVLFYGNTATNPERFMGFSPRYNTTSTSTSQTANNFISAGGAGSDNTSIWLVGWGDLTVHGIFPKGSKAGLSMKDLGEQTLLDAAGNRYQGYRTHYKWDAGLTVRDWRYVVRIGNIDVSDLAGSTPADLVKLMMRAMNKIPNIKMCKPAWYMNRTVKQWLDIQRNIGAAVSSTTNNSNIRRTLDESDGRIFDSFGGIPIRKCDQITLAEATVS